MFYRYSLTVPANTAQSAPVTETMYLAHGIIHQVEVGFPPGCAALVHVAIFRFEHQVWPTNPDGEFAWDDYTVVIREEDFGLVHRPYTLSLRAWSEDDTFPHTISCSIGIKQPELHRPGSWVKKLLQGETQG
uniref:Uncharacterized protein n=1 Tax=viral metagenome TaxID=1070528 RepID=A0A6H1ZUW1_9ZZZZ